MPPLIAQVALAFVLIACLVGTAWGFNNIAHQPAVKVHQHQHQCRSSSTGLHLFLNTEKGENNQASHLDNNDATGNGRNIVTPDTRRNFLASMASSVIITTNCHAMIANAVDDTKSTSDAKITDKIYIEFKGLSTLEPTGTTTDRITIGLFGNEAPQPVSILKQLVTRAGYKSNCKPLDDTRVFQKEQLEANKVYKNCIETEDSVGVNYDYATVWRVVKDERIDLGAVSGKFIARENPTFGGSVSSNGLRHDEAGVVSVRRGNEGGYGFTIYPGGNTDTTTTAATLDEDNIVVGRVIDGMDVIAKLNDMPTVKNALASKELKSSPSRGCRYGGNEYFCAENKPLKKVLLDKFGVL